MISEIASLKKLEHIFMNDDNVSSAGILMRKEQIAIIALALWLTIVSVFMLLTQQVDLEIFFIVFLVAILVLVYLMEPNFVQPRYLRYLRYLIAAGIVIFGLIVAQKVMEILRLEIVF
jgi:hypothetical protein